MRQIADLLLQGCSVRVIADKVGLLKPTAIQSRIKKLRKEWQKEAAVDFAAHQAQALAKLKMVQRNAWEMFFKSCQDYKQVTKSKSYAMKKEDSEDGGAPQGKSFQPTTKTDTDNKFIAHGNPKYLSIITDCIEKEARLLGVYDWIRKEINEDGAGSGVAEIYLNQQVYIPGLGVINPELLTPELWEALHGLLLEQNAHSYG